MNAQGDRCTYGLDDHCLNEPADHQTCVAHDHQMNALDDHHDAEHDHQSYEPDDHHDAEHDHQMNAQGDRCTYGLDDHQMNAQGDHHDAEHDHRMNVVHGHHDAVHDLSDRLTSDHDLRHHCHIVNHRDHRELARVVGTKAHLKVRAHRLLQPSADPLGERASHQGQRLRVKSALKLCAVALVQPG